MAGRLPQVEFYIGEKSLMVPPNHLASFVFIDTVSPGGDAFTLEFIDPTWDILESDLIPSMRSNIEKAVSFRWGWGGKRMSKLRYGTVTEFTPSEITRGGIRIVMKGWDRPSSAQESHARNTAEYQGKISDVVDQIADKNGWATDIEITDEIRELEGRKGGKQLKTWRQVAKTDLEFLTELAQKANSSKSTGAFRVYLDSTKQPAVLHFHPSRAHQYPVSRTYIVQEDNMGEVIVFNPTIEGTLPVSLGLSKTSVVSRDPVTRKLLVKEATPDTFQDGISTGSKSPIEAGHGVRKIAPPVTEEELDARLKNYYEALSWSVSKGALELVGDELLDPGRLIEVIVKTPKGRRYFISGKYLLEKVTHSITPGNYTCQCELVKDSFDVGDLPLAKGRA